MFNIPTENWRRMDSEIGRRALMYWFYFEATGDQKAYDNYIYWYMVYCQIPRDKARDIAGLP